MTFNYIIPSSLKNLEHFIVDIRLWMIKIFLKLNDDKTDMIYFASSIKVKIRKALALKIGDSFITPEGHVQL